MCRHILTQLFLFVVFTNVVNGLLGEVCDNQDLKKDSKCDETQVCDEHTNRCMCKPGYATLNNSQCLITHTTEVSPTKLTTTIVNTADNIDGSVAVKVLVPILLIVIVISGIYATIKYNLITWFRSKLHRRSSHYDEFMIGQDLDDDPPLQ